MVKLKQYDAIKYQQKVVTN